MNDNNLILPQAVLWHKKDHKDLNIQKDLENILKLENDNSPPITHQYHQHHQHQPPPAEIELSRFPPYPQNPARAPSNQTLAPPHQVPPIQYTQNIQVSIYIYI
jgi:hypothetical protein